MQHMRISGKGDHKCALASHALSPPNASPRPFLSFLTRSNVCAVCVRVRARVSSCKSIIMLEIFLCMCTYLSEHAFMSVRICSYMCVRACLRACQLANLDLHASCYHVCVSPLQSQANNPQTFHEFSLACSLFLSF